MDRRETAKPLVVLRPVLLAGAASILCACAASPDLTGSKATANPAIASAIARAKAEPLPFPKFTDIPEVPTNAPSRDVWRTGEKGLQDQAVSLSAATNFTPEISDADAFARSTLQGSGLDAIAAPDAASAASTEALARELRERATPPPPPQ